jgi:hypothetical protein
MIISLKSGVKTLINIKLSSENFQYWSGCFELKISSFMKQYIVSPLTLKAAIPDGAKTSKTHSFVSL